MTKALNWHLKYETSAWVNEAQESCAEGSYCIQCDVIIARNKSNKRCGRSEQQGKVKPGTVWSKIKDE